MSEFLLLDTSVVIDLDQVDLGRFAEAVSFVSSVTVAELAYGLDVDDPVERHNRTARFEATLSQFEVLPFDTEVARLYGTMAALVRRTGRDPRPRRLDLQIAATAGSHSLALLTRNPDDFTGLGRMLEVEAV